MDGVVFFCSPAEQQPDRSCSVCGVDIRHRPPSFKTCSSSCSYTRDRMRQVERTRRSNKKRQEAARALKKENPKTCLQCGSFIDRRGNAKFCCHECLVSHSRAVERGKREEVRKNRTPRFCKWCDEEIPASRHASSTYCCVECQYKAAKAYERDKIAQYRLEYPERHKAYREKENLKRQQANAAMKLLKEIQNKGLEALL